MKNPTVGFVTFEQYHRKANIGSTRIRCDWLINNWENAERYFIGKDYDVMIYQKAYWVEHAKRFDGVKILDICDADWLSWGYDIKAMIDAVDAISCSTQAIAEVLVNTTDKPIWIIPDRLDFDEETPIKEHVGDLKKVVWFGYQHNQSQLIHALPALQKRKLELIVLSEKPYVMPSGGKGLEIKNLPWSKDHWKNDIIKGDVVLCPNDKKGRFKFKSDNKIIQSWALGMPVASIDSDLDKYLTEQARKEEADKRLKEVQERYNVKDSVKEYQQLIQSIYESRAKNKTAISK